MSKRQPAKPQNDTKPVQLEFDFAAAEEAHQQHLLAILSVKNWRRDEQAES
jgi:hypothetical protein